MNRFGRVLISVLVFCGGLQAGTLYFPHYGDGGGLSMLFSVTNPSEVSSSVRLSFFAPSGATATLPLTQGSRSFVQFTLPPGTTRVFRTNGASNPVKSGFVTLESDNDQVTGLAVFRFDSGAEASVLPIRQTRWRSLFAETGPNLDTGLAIVRTSGSHDINYKIYDESGRRIASGRLVFAGSQAAAFFSDLFPSLPANFTGSLVMDSAEPFGVVGLRFGNGRLSTAPSPEFAPRGLALLRRFAEPSGLWFFGFTIGTSTFDNRYTVYQVADLTTPGQPDDFLALGADEFGDPVVASYDDSSAEVDLLDQGSILDRLFSFRFTSDNDITGCYRQILKSDGSISACYPLSGLRFDGEVLLSQSRPQAGARVSGEEAESEALQATGTFSAPSPGMAARIARLRKRVSAPQSVPVN